MLHASIYKCQKLPMNVYTSVGTNVYTCRMAEKRKPMTQDKNILIRIDEKLKEKAQRAAFKKGLSLSDFIRLLLKENS